MRGVATAYYTFPLMGEAARLASLLASRSRGGAWRLEAAVQGRTITPIQLCL